jgi:hypothetical protein
MLCKVGKIEGLLPWFVGDYKVFLTNARKGGR